MADSSPSSIPFQSPTTGAIQNVTSDQWDAALSAGYKPTDHTLMYSPGGQRGMVPNEQLRDYVNQGYAFDQNTQQMNQAARQGGATPKAAKPATDPVMKASQQYSQTLDPQQRYLYNLPAEQRPAAEQRMESGSSMAIPSFLAGFGTLRPIEAISKQGLVQGAKTVGLRFLRPLIGTAVGSEAGERIGRPIGRLFGDEQAGETGGRYVGGALGAGALSSPAQLSEVPFLGRFLTTDQEYADLQAARTLARQQAMERAVANSPEAQQRALGEFMNKGYENVQESPELGTPQNPGWMAKLPTRMPQLPAPQPELGSPENPGWMAKLPTRMPSTPAPPVPEPELGSAENPGWFARLPSRMPTPQEAPATPELGSPTNPGWVVNLPSRMPKAANESATSIVRGPSEGAPRFSGNEGRAATWTNEQVLRMASQGNRVAIQQAVRRGLSLPENARYIMGDADFPRGVYDPRDVTSFGPEGTPIRTGGKKLTTKLPWMP